MRLIWLGKYLNINFWKAFGDDVMNYKILILFLIVGMIAITGCTTGVPEQYKNDVCASTCYPQLTSGIDPKAVTLYNEHRDIFDQIEKPVCRNYRNLGVTEEQITEFYCNASITGIARALPECNGCDTFCDCQLKDGRYLDMIVYNMTTLV